MKKIHIVSAFMALSVLFSCVPDHRDFNMPDAAVYFSDNSANNGVQTVLMYDVQSEVENPVYVYCGGLQPESAKVTTRVAEEYIEYYNKVKYTDLKALPAECYSLVKSSDELNDRTASFSLKFDVAKVAAFAEEVGNDLANYVVSLRLDADNLDIATVKDTTSLGYYLVRPDLRTATLKISSTGMTPDGKMTVVAELPFENTWDLTYDVEFATPNVDELFTSKGNTYPAKYLFAKSFPEGTVITNEEVKSMSAGTNQVVYDITMPEDVLTWKPGQAYNFAINFSNAVLNGKEIPIENPMIVASLSVGVDIKASNSSTELGTNLAAYGIKPLDDKQGGGRTGEYLENIDPNGGFIFHPQTSQNTVPSRSYTLAGVFDDNVSDTGRSWMQNWGRETGYGPTSFSTPYWMLVDMQSEFQMGGVEFWTRSDGRYNMKEVEIYALDDCSYTLNQSVLNYESSDLTYLGKMTFTGGAQNVSVTVDPIKTRYIMLLITKASGGLDCQELVLWGI